MRSNPRHPPLSRMPGALRWNCPYSSATGSINRPSRKLLAIPGITLKTACEIERVGARVSWPYGDDDRSETVDRGEARAHFGDQIVLRDQKKVPAAMLRQTVGQFPVVLGRAALQLPLDRIKRVWVHVVDQRREGLAIVGEQYEPGMRSELGADGRTEGPPAAQPAQRIVVRRQRDAEGRKRIASGEQDCDRSEMERDRERDECAPASRQRPGNDQHRSRDKGWCGPIGV